MTFPYPGPLLIFFEIKAMDLDLGVDELLP